MGTRADFYLQEGDELRLEDWLGSIAWDGDSISSSIAQSTNPEEYKHNVLEFLNTRNDATLPEQGWPWPWDDSNLTDCSYLYRSNALYTTRYGKKEKNWILLKDKEYLSWEQLEELEEYDGDLCKFPDMSSIKKATLGKRSGLITLGV